MYVRFTDLNTYFPCSQIQKVEEVGFYNGSSSFSSSSTFYMLLFLQNKIMILIWHLD